MAPDARIYLCGRVTVERNGRTLSEAALGGRQGRLLFAFLGTRRTQPVSKAHLIDAIWGPRTPPSVETAINALVSKLRAALRKLGVPRPHGVASDVGTYQFVVPSAWIDIEDARTAIDRAEGALRGNAAANAWASANVAAAITNSASSMPPRCWLPSRSTKRPVRRSCVRTPVAGNRAEALRVYANCRKLFRDELGTEPSEQTAAVFLSILRTQ